MKNMNNYEIVNLIAKELGYNRFCGTIAAKNESHKLNTTEECELADLLANRNINIFREDALVLLDKILNELSISGDLQEYVKDELEYLRSISNNSSDITMEEITNPIMNLEI